MVKKNPLNPFLCRFYLEELISRQTDTSLISCQTGIRIFIVVLVQLWELCIMNELGVLQSHQIIELFHFREFPVSVTNFKYLRKKILEIF